MSTVCQANGLNPAVQALCSNDATTSRISRKTDSKEKINQQMIQDGDRHFGITLLQIVACFLLFNRDRLPEQMGLSSECSEFKIDSRMLRLIQECSEFKIDSRMLRLIQECSEFKIDSRMLRLIRECSEFKIDSRMLRLIQECSEFKIDSRMLRLIQECFD
ncbi:hypothetical protein AVEN_68130-1 [Araneus ventricosus]|uniref:Uncharacterized protein n=1 Tax=Araneus ventricosus TaxID=182803 RepID=A0A4Y2K5C8_ARAVE|nr:hypothetical protein AVEN_68130-1 [Araneus ventricosus]